MDVTVPLPAASTSSSVTEPTAADLAATSAFDTGLLDAEPDTLGHWRLLGALHLAHPAQLSAADPCTTPMTLSQHLLAPGDYQWQVRDADEHGNPTHRVAEVRLVRVDGPGDPLRSESVPEWRWVDDYGRTPTQVAPGCEPTRFVGIDTATLRWEARPEYTLPPGQLPDFDEDTADDYSRYEEGLSDGGQVCTTSTGWGDGGYPIACRIHTEADTSFIVEARASFLTDPAAPLCAEQFLALLPGAFTHTPLIGQLELTWDCTRYRTHDTPADSWRGYDRIVSGLDTGRRDMEHARARRDNVDDDDFLTGGDIDDHTLAGIAHLWDRLRREDRVQVAAAVYDTEHRDRPDNTRGSITSYVTFTRTVHLMT